MYASALKLVPTFVILAAMKFRLNATLQNLSVRTDTLPVDYSRVFDQIMRGRK